jgi:catechol 2,3-dioxygenase-like lactoylglutathione lyase family enzyme
MINGVQDIYYNVSNMDESVKFYSEILGMEVISKDQYWTNLSCGGVKIGLHWTEGGPVPPIKKDSHGAHCGGTLTLKSTDVEADKKMLEDAGVEILGNADAPWGKMVVFTDIDGNVLKLMQPKY